MSATMARRSGAHFDIRAIAIRCSFRHQGHSDQVLISTSGPCLLAQEWRNFLARTGALHVDNHGTRGLKCSRDSVPTCVAWS
jgi:hypothetical protein